MPNYAVQTTNGKMHTVEVDESVAEAARTKLARDRAELRAMIAGNVQFYDDPNARPAVPPAADEPSALYEDGRAPGWYLVEYLRAGGNPVELRMQWNGSQWTHWAGPLGVVHHYVSTYAEDLRPLGPCAAP